MTDKPVAMIIGGGSGIGADSANKLSEDGFDVAVMSSSGKGEALGNELGGLGFTGSNLVVEDLEKFVALTMERFGRIDSVINCAGHGPVISSISAMTTGIKGLITTCSMWCALHALFFPSCKNKAMGPSSIFQHLQFLNLIRISRLRQFTAPVLQVTQSSLAANMQKRIFA